MAEVGYLALILGLVLSLYAIVAQIVGIKKNNEKLAASARGAVIATAFLLTVASGILLYFLAVSDFSIRYVSEYTSWDLPLLYKLSAFWAGNAGSLLLWVLVLAIYAAVAVTLYKKEKLTSYAVPVLMLNVFAFLFVLAFVSNPFEKLAFAPTNGSGLNPMLQNPGMIIHPVTTYLGYVGFAIPFAYAIAALITNYAGDVWIRITRRWTIIAWLFLSLGNLYGAQWAYVELGWGGYWAWDPVENASFLPWLTGSAFLHSVMVQERKNMLRIWNMLLIIITFVLTFFGTFLVRSGILSSVHAFGNSSLGIYFLGFTLFALLASLYLLVDRLNMLKEGNQFESFISKESSFLLNNLLLVGSAFAVFWGTIFPLISEAVRGVKITVGAPFFNTVFTPMSLGFIFLMGICPLIAWRKASWKNIKEQFIIPFLATMAFILLAFALGMRKPIAFLAFSACFFVISSTLYDIIKGVLVRRRITGEGHLSSLFNLAIRNRRRYGGYIIHVGIILIALGVMGSNIYEREVDRTLRFGETMTIGGYALRYERLDTRYERDNEILYAELRVSKGGRDLGYIRPEKIFYPTHPQPATEVAIKGNLKEDLYVILAGWEKDGSATFRVLINPLVAWMWIGGYFLIAGTIFSLWPGRGSQVGAKYIQRSEAHEA